MRFTKDNITFHSDHGRSHPAYNIKVETYLPTVLRRVATDPALTEFRDPDFLAWIDERWEAEDEVINDTWSWACEGTYDDCKGELLDLFSVRERDIWQEGRSGGWMVVDWNLNTDNWGRHCTAHWDAIAVSRYWRGYRIVQDYKSGFVYNWLWQLFYNVYERELDEARLVEERRVKEAQRDQEMTMAVLLTEAMA